MDLNSLLRKEVLVFTGAGISVASGIQPFRGAGGMYEGLNPYDLATPRAFLERTTTVWNWYLARIHGGLGAKPNPAHLALADLERFAERVIIVTSNVDPLHELAGSKRVFHLHGDILKVRCWDCELELPIAEGFRVDSIRRLPKSIDDTTQPRCDCGGMFRPAVVWFGEYPDDLAVVAAQTHLASADLVMEVGVSGAVSYGFTEMAIARGTPTVRINPDAQPESGVVTIAEPAEIALPRLVSLASH